MLPVTQTKLCRTAAEVLLLVLTAALMFNRYGYNFWERLLFLPGRSQDAVLTWYLKGKTILITGASFGIGESLATLFAHAGVRLILVARTAEKLKIVQQHAAARGAEVFIYPVDLTDREQLAGLIVYLQALPGGVDILVSNAGKSIMRPLEQSLLRFADFTRTMELNYFAPVQLTLALIPLLAKNKGHIINVSAINVLLPAAPYWAAYQASKSAIDQWFQSAAAELKLWDIVLSNIYLPLVKTRMITPNKQYRNMPAMHPLHVANIIGNCIVSRKRKYYPWWLPFVRMMAKLFRHAWQKRSLHYFKRNTTS